MNAGIYAELLATEAVRAVICTRPDGTIEGVYGALGTEAERIGAWLHVSAGAVGSIERAGIQTAALKTSILQFEHLTLVVSHLPNGQKRAVVAESHCSPGLLLSQLRRLSEERSM